MEAANDSHITGPALSVYITRQAMRGYALNRMCYSFNKAENRHRFKVFPEAYCLKYGLNRAQISAVTDLDVMRMLEAGGNIYYLQKLTCIYGLDLYELWAEQNAQHSNLNTRTTTPNMF